MTTGRSPLSQLKAQADMIAAQLKAAERGEMIASDPAGKIAASKALGVVNFGVVMDDKVLSIEMPWSKIKSTSEAALSELILKYMRDQREAEH